MKDKKISKDLREQNEKLLRRFLLIVVNAVIISVILLMCEKRVESHSLAQKKETRDNFAANAASMRSVASIALLDAKQACRDDAAYINKKNMSLSEALNYLNDANTEESIMYHIIDYDTYTGYSSKADEKGNITVDYSSFSSVFDISIDIIKNGYADGNLCITSSYTNPTTHRQSIGFLHDVNIVEENGIIKTYLLIRVIRTDDIISKWVFPGLYADAELSLITASGAYIIKSESLKNQNFWEYVRINNEIGYDDAEKIRDELYADSSAIKELKDAADNDAYYVCVPFSNDSEGMYYVAYIPVDSLKQNQLDYSLMLIVFSGMILLIFFNGIYIIYINLKLKKSNEAAIKASKAKSEFLSSMSHDIRTPMNAILGMTAIAKENTGDKDKTDKYLGKIEAAGNQMLTLINDVLDISKIESNSMVFNETDVDILKLFGEELDIIEVQAGNKNITVKNSVDNIIYNRVRVDEIRLKQIFTNLLSNAVKYTNENGRIKVGLREEEIIESDSVNLIFTVEDNGIGMSKEFMKVMFDPFSRMVDTRVNKIQGTGLGLAITSKIVKLMNGKIDCESEEGKGTKIEVTIKVQGLSEAEPGRETANINEINKDKINKNDIKSIAKELGEVKFLVAEDNDMNWEIISTMLSMYGFESVRAENGKAAVEMLKENNEYDVVLMDVQMPIMNGIEATKEIRKLGIKGRTDSASKANDSKNYKGKKGNNGDNGGNEEYIPIIAMTADAFAEDVKKCLDAGMDAHMSKPVDIKKLFIAVKQILGR